MKQVICLLCLVALLSGCAAVETFETISDEPVKTVMAPMAALELELPDHASAPVSEREDGSKLYLCDGYVLTIQTLSSGDMRSTVREVSGFSDEDLTIVRTEAGDVDRYEWVWTAAGEGGDQLFRAVVLDDDAYHYCVTVMAAAEDAGALAAEWDAVLGSVTLSQY